MRIQSTPAICMRSSATSHSCRVLSLAWPPGVIYVPQTQEEEWVVYVAQPQTPYLAFPAPYDLHVPKPRQYPPFHTNEASLRIWRPCWIRYLQLGCCLQNHPDYVGGRTGSVDPSITRDWLGKAPHLYFFSFFFLFFYFILILSCTCPSWQAGKVSHVDSTYLRRHQCWSMTWISAGPKKNSFWEVWGKGN